MFEAFEHINKVFFLKFELLDGVLISQRLTDRSQEVAPYWFRKKCEVVILSLDVYISKRADYIRVEPKRAPGV